MSTQLLELCNIHAAYLQKEVLRDVSLTVQAGEMVALLGENGSGKSSTLKVVAGLLPPKQGTVRFRGRKLNDLDTANRQKLGIGYLMQGGRVFPNLTVRENFDLAATQARNTKSKAIYPGEWFPILGDRFHDRAGLLSGGQRQMLAIEIILAQQPDLLLLDEPTAALAGDLAANILQVISQYVMTTSSAALLVEQNVRLAQVACARTLYLEQGTLPSGR